MDLTLYSYWRSSSAWRVRIVMNLKNLTYNCVPINLLKHENVNSEFLSNNPLGQVPCLIAEGVSISQSLAIIHYLETAHPEPSLLPRNVMNQCKMWEVCEIINSGIQPLQNLPILELAEAAGKTRKEWAQGVIVEGFVAVEKILERYAGTYAIGDEVTLADALLVPQLYNARRFEVDLAPFPVILRVTESASALEAFQRAHPDRQVDAVIG